MKSRERRGREEPCGGQPRRLAPQPELRRPPPVRHRAGRVPAAAQAHQLQEEGRGVTAGARFHQGRGEHAPQRSQPTGSAESGPHHQLPLIQARANNPVSGPPAPV